MKKLKIGISSCLLGEKVRYDGGHKYDPWINEKLGTVAEFVPFCPEMFLNLGSPRPSIRLEKSPFKKDEHILVARENVNNPELVGIDLLPRMKSILSENQLTFPELHGYIFMKKSPSCGLSKIKIYEQLKNGQTTFVAPNDSMGVFAKSFVEKYPLTPILESGRVYSDIDRERFLRQIYARAQFCNLTKSISALQEFHRNYKMLLYEHSPVHLNRLGKICAQKVTHHDEVIQTFRDYEILFFQTMNILPSVKNRVNALMHMKGFFKKILSKDEKMYLEKIFQEFKSQTVSYEVPLTLIDYLTNKYQVDYLLEQKIFRPFPRSLYGL